MPPAEGAAAPAAVPKSAFEAAAAKPSSEDSSVGRRRSVSAFAASLEVCPATITMDKAVSGVLGIDSIEDIDKDGQFIKVEHLRRLKTIGVGTYAEVYEAEYLGPPLPGGEGPAGGAGGAPSRVAVKALRGGGAALVDDDVLDFVREARLLVRLRHPNVVRFVGVGAARPADPWRTLFLVQEFCDRGSMKARLFRQMQEPFRHAYAYAEALRWSAEIAAGLAFLHAARPKVIHRDLKADNVLLATGPGGAEVAKIADLGLHVLVQNASLARSGGSATPRSGGSSLHGGDAAALALADAGSPMRADAVAPNAPSGGRALSYVLTGRTGAFCYMAPEVLMGQPYSESVDVFSLGVIMHELFSRRLLCAALMNTNEWDESEGHARRVAAGFRPAIPAELPAELRALIDACWHGVPELRPSAREVVRRLAAIKATGALAAMDAERAAAKGGACCAVQ